VPPAEAPLAAPSSLLLDHLDALRAGAGRGPVLDLACGRGRNVIELAAQGIPVVRIDRDRGFLHELRRRGAALPAPPSALRADLEEHADLPVRAGSCAAILVFRFLFRPLCPAIARALRPGGLLLYETFTTRQRALGRGPTRDAFLLEPGELPGLFPALERLHHDEAEARGSPPEATARLVARAPAPPS